jgi:hypothetical protein
MCEEVSEYNSKRAGFIIGNKQVLFINTDTKNQLEALVKENLLQIQTYYQKKGFDFIYLPDVVNQLDIKSPSQRSYFTYFYPYLVNEPEAIYFELENNPYPFIANTLGLLADESPCVYSHYSKNTSKIDSLESIFQFLNEEQNVIVGTAKFAISKRESTPNNTIINEHTILFEIRDSPLKRAITPNERKYEDQFDQLDEEVIRKIEELKNPDTIKFLIQILSNRLSKSVENKLSRLLIDENYAIRLIDYGDMEIQLTPLQKVVYLFFLNHPEGIMYHSIFEHKAEFLAIYLKISNRDDMQQLKASIDDLVDPQSNSLSEKCSRIRNAFLMKIDESLASKYFIEGLRGEPKSIKLPRELIEIRTGIKQG